MRRDQLDVLGQVQLDLFTQPRPAAKPPKPRPRFTFERDVVALAVAADNAKTIVDARRRFQRRTNDLVRRLMIGWVPPTSGGADPIDLATVRTARRRDATRAVVDGEAGGSAA